MATEATEQTTEAILDEMPPVLDMEMIRQVRDEVAAQPDAPQGEGVKVPFEISDEPVPKYTKTIVEDPMGVHTADSDAPQAIPDVMDDKYALESDVVDAFAAVKETTDGLQTLLNQIKEAAGKQHDKLLGDKIREWEGRLNKLVADSKRQTDKLQKCLALADSEINRWKKAAEGPHEDKAARESIGNLERQIKALNEKIERNATRSRPVQPPRK